MTRVALDEVVECLDRSRVPVKESERVPGDVPYYGANGQQGWIDHAIFNEPLVVVAEDGGHFASPARGVAYRIAGPSWVNNHGHVLRATARVDHAYLFHSLRNYDFSSYISGSTRSKLTQGQLMQAEIPLPPLDEQRRIAAILDHADALRAKRQQVLTHLDALTRSTFAKVAGTATRRASLRELGVDFLSGKNVLGVGPNTHHVNRVIKVSAISSGRFVATESKPMPSDYAPPPSHRLRRGDILFGRASGSLDLLGATAVVDTEPADLYLPDKVWRLVIQHSADVEPGYALGVLCSVEARAFIRHNASGAAGVRNIGKARLLEFVAPVVPRNAQRAFIERWHQVDRQRAVVQRAQAADNDLFAALQLRAFRGEL